MAQEIELKLTERKTELELELEKSEALLRDYSRNVSETQVLILELRGELKGLVKMLNSLKGEK